MNEIKQEYKEEFGSHDLYSNLYKETGNYKGNGKYSDHYVDWLESRVLLMTKLAAKVHEDLIVAHELSILIKEAE